MNRGSFVISGSNGSGKSGVVDAIQFALTGEIGPLKGPGTGDLTISEHGPHVERRSDPEACSVQLNVYIPELNKSASISRTIKKPKQPAITPNDPAVKAVFARAAAHPEATLARREIIKFILTEAAQRSRDVQTLLKLDDIDQVRATLKTTENKLNTELSAAKTQFEAAADSLKRHFDLSALKTEDILTVVNKRRLLLGLTPLSEVSKETILSEGILAASPLGDAAQPKESVLADIKALLDRVTAGVEMGTEAVVKALLTDIATLVGSPALLALIKRHGFLQTGLELVDGPQCPLCDTAWDIGALRLHCRRNWLSRRLRILCGIDSSTPRRPFQEKSSGSAH